MNAKEKVLKQVSFYFSDNNLLRDKFMRSKIKENDGWIDMDCLLTFNRLKQLCNDKTKLLEYLDQNTDGFLEVDREKLAVRRHKDHPVPDISPKEFYNNIKLQTVVLKGFPHDNSINIDTIEKFFQDLNVQGVVDIRLMRNAAKDFVGKLYVQFKTEELAKKFSEDSNKLQFTLENNDFDIKKITVYSVCYADDLLVGFRDEHREKSKNKKQEKARERFYDQIGYKNDNEPARCGFQPGKLIHFNSSIENLTRESIKDALKDTFSIKWIHFNKGDKEGIIEMANGGDAIKLCEQLKNDEAKCFLKITLNNSGEEKQEPLQLNLVEGQSEINFWRSKLTNKKNKNINNTNAVKKRMRNNPKSVKPEGKLTKFSDDESSEE